MTDKHYLRLTGIPTESPNDKELYFAFNPTLGWFPSSGNLFLEIDQASVEIHEALAKKLFLTSENYYDFLKTSPILLSNAGLDSESSISKVQLETFVKSNENSNEGNKALYLYDCRKLVSSIQECLKEVLQIQGEFYKTLNLEEFFYPLEAVPDGIRYTSSPITTKLHSYLSFIYIRLHSILDYITKLSIEVENLRTTFTAYPKLVSNNKIYGQRQRISFNKMKGTLFESCNLINEIETVRNHLIHDGLIDDMPKAYEVIENGKSIEKYILFPDMAEHQRFDSFKNRKLFYSGEDKINLRLPNLIQEFQSRLLTTLQHLLTCF